MASPYTSVERRQQCGASFEALGGRLWVDSPQARRTVDVGRYAGIADDLRAGNAE
jgi:hypothetical protein